MAIAPQRNGFAEINASRRELAATESTPAGVASLSFCTPARRSAPMWWLWVQAKFVRDAFRVIDAAVQNDVDADGQESHGALR
jgi:hypothetical protein